MIGRWYILEHSGRQRLEEHYLFSYYDILVSDCQKSVLIFLLHVLYFNNKVIKWTKPRFPVSFPIFYYDYLILGSRMLGTSVGLHWAAPFLDWWMSSLDILQTPQNKNGPHWTVNPKFLPCSLWFVVRLNTLKVLFLYLPSTLCNTLILISWCYQNHS